MEIISLILSGLALLAAVLNLILFFREKKRNESSAQDKLLESAKDYEETLRYRSAVGQELSKLATRVCDLENGASLDYNAAVEAKNAVDDFATGIMNILTYGNPVPAKKKAENTEEVKG